MAGWLTALKLVPWVDVVRSAPQIAEGARKLWQTVGRNKAERPAAGAAISSPAATEGNEPLAALTTRVLALERELADATELIHSLAEQDKQLIAQIERLQHRERWLWRALAVLALGLVAAFWRASGV